jgi:hypothetical protein
MPNAQATQIESTTYVGDEVGAFEVGVGVGCAKGDSVIGRTVMSEFVPNIALRPAYPPTVVYLWYEPS